MAPMVSGVNLSLKPQSNCELYSAGGEANFVAASAAVGSEIACQGRTCAATGLTNSTDTRMYLIAFMGTLIRGFNVALLCHETIHPHQTQLPGTPMLSTGKMVNRDYAFRFRGQDVPFSDLSDGFLPG